MTSQRFGVRQSVGNSPVVLLVVCLLAFVTSASHAQVIHSERSLYRNILVTDERGERCLRFSVQRQERNQSCMLLRDRDRIVFPYVRMMLASLLVAPEPKRILIVGLGGGTMPTALRGLLPDAHIDVVEIDAAVVEVAERFFDFRTDPEMKVYTADARVFVKRALRRDARYDLVMLDAFGGDYIPEHLMTAEFLQETRGLLTERGVLAANTFASSRLYHHESATYAEVYGSFFNVRSPDSNNRIIIATANELPSAATLNVTAQDWYVPMRKLHVDPRRMPSRMSTDVDWNRDARLLTDQYSPANLLE